MKKIFSSFLIVSFLALNLNAATVTETIGTTGRDHSTITLWEANLDDDPTYDAGDDAVGEIYDDSTFDEDIVQNGGGTIGLNSVRLTVPLAERHDGTEGSGARIVRSVGTGANILFDLTTIPSAGTEKFVLEWLEIDGNGQNIGILLRNSAAIDRQPVLRNNILHGNASDTANSHLVRADTRDARIQNNIFYDFTTTANNRDAWAIDIDADRAGGGVFNNTIWGINAHGTGSGRGINVASDDVDGDIKNNVVMNVTSDSGSADDFVWTGITNVDSDYNMSEDATADDPGTSNNLISQSVSGQFVSTSGGSEDLHLVSGSTAIDEGVDLATGESREIDIDGRDRDSEGDTWDIGAHEFVAVAGAVDKRNRPIRVMFFD